MDVFQVFDNLKVKGPYEYAGQIPITHQLRELDKQEKLKDDRQLIDQTLKQQDPNQILHEKKMATIYELLKQDLIEKCQEQFQITKG